MWKKNQTTLVSMALLALLACKRNAETPAKGSTSEPATNAVPLERY